MRDIDFWVSRQEKIRCHEYDATKNCYNFEESYLECLKIYESKVV